MGLVETPVLVLVQSCYLSSDPGSMHVVALPDTGWDSVSHFDNGVCFSHVPFGISKTNLHLVPLRQELELGVDSPPVCSIGCYVGPRLLCQFRTHFIG